MKPVNKVQQTLFGIRVRALRARAGLTLEELAFRSGLHPNYLGDIERGARNISLANIEKIAAGLGMPVARLFICGKTKITSADSFNRSLQELIKLLRKNSPRNRNYVLTQAKALAKHLALAKENEALQH